MLGMVEPPGRRDTLMAGLAGEQAGMPVWRLDLRLQGGSETLFMEI